MVSHDTASAASEAPIFEFQRTWLSIKQGCVGHKWLILATFLFTMSLLTVYIFVWQPIYSADVELIAESEKDMAREGFYQNWAVFRKDALADEVHLFTSAPVLGAVVDRLGLTYNDVYHPLLSHLTYIWQESLPGRTYREIKEMIWPKRPGPYDPTPEQIERARTVTDFKSGVQIVSVSGTNVGNLVVRGPSPRVAEIGNEIVKVYFEQRRARHVREAEDAYAALEIELEKARRELHQLEQRMAEYYERNQLILTFEKDKLDVSQWTALKATIVDLKSTIASQENSLREVEAQLADEQKLIVSSQVTMPNPIAQGLSDKLAQTEVSRQQLLTKFRLDAPEVRELDQQIAILKREIANRPATAIQQKTTVINDSYEALRRRKAALDAELSGLRAALAVKQDAADRAQVAIAGIPEKMKANREFDREHAALEKKYTVLQEKLMIAAVSRATAASAPMSIWVVQPATPPSAASWPRTKLLYAIAIVLSVIVGVALALLVDLLRGRVTRYTLAQRDHSLPLYAIVGRSRGSAARLFAPRRMDTDGRGGERSLMPIAGNPEVSD